MTSSSSTFSDKDSYPSRSTSPSPSTEPFLPSEEKTETKPETPETSRRLFPTPTAREENYPFVKKADHFKNVLLFIPEDKSTHHQIFCLNKKRKSNATWYSVTNNHVKKECLERQHHFSIAAGEIFRLKFGGPKYRIKKINAKDPGTLLSKGVPGFQSFTHYSFYANLTKPRTFDDSDYIQNSGRVLLSEALWEQNDLHGGNLCMESSSTLDHPSDVVNNDKFMNAIDPAESFWTLTSAFQRPQFVRFAGIGLLNDLREKLIFRYKPGSEKREKVLLKGVPFSSIGEFSVTAYEFLPLPAPKHFPCNSDFRCLTGYGTFLSTHPTFLNEKFLQTIFELVTRHITLETGEIHIAHDQDRDNFKALVNKILNNFLTTVSQSEAFLIYFATHAINAIKVILYEINDFLEKNKHYRQKTSTAILIQQQEMTEIVIKELTALLKATNTTLSSTTLAELESFPKKLFSDNSILKREALREVYSFYQGQGMTLRAKNVNALIGSLSPASSSRLFANSLLTSPVADPNKIPNRAPIATQKKEWLPKVHQMHPRF
jgi:hypothetical protein